MLISKDMYERWSVLCPAAHEAHRPTAGYRKQDPGSNFTRPANLAADASVEVDSFYGTLNLDDASELYPLLNQVRVDWQLRPGTAIIDLRLATETPGFAYFRWQFDGAAAQSGLKTALAWGLHAGRNTFTAQAVNNAGHAGRPSRLVFDYRPGGAPALVEEHNGAATPPAVPFGWEDFSHPRLQALRQKYHLDEVIGGCSSDLERVVRLRDWVKTRWDHEQPITSPPWDAFYILDRTDKKIESFYCVHYSVAYMQCCLALGIPARLLNLGRGICDAPIERRGYGRELNPECPCDEHVINEVWLDDEGRWVMMDVDFDIHYQRNDRVLSGLEIHNTLLEGKLDELVVCEGPLAHKLRSSDRFYQYLLTVYYTHFCVFWRNDHLSDPSGPTRILHWLDEKTPPMLLWEGSDLRHHPMIIGPLGVSWPFAKATPRLNDQNVLTCWASSEEAQEHWVELKWEAPQTFARVVVDWAECWQVYWTAAELEVQAWQGEKWVKIASVSGQGETATTIFEFAPQTTGRLRLVMPAGGGHHRFPDRLWLAEVEVYSA